MDVDGTLTDGKIYMGPNGEMMKAFNVRDGYGIHNILLPEGIIPVIITGRNSQIVALRAYELGVREVYQGVANKLAQLKDIIKRYGFSLSSVAYMGDDLNDLECMKAVKEEQGLVGCPADADLALREYCDFVSVYGGGSGALREFVDYIVKKNSQCFKKAKTIDGLINM